MLRKSCLFLLLVFPFSFRRKGGNRAPVGCLGFRRSLKEKHGPLGSRFGFHGFANSRQRMREDQGSEIRKVLGSAKKSHLYRTDQRLKNRPLGDLVSSWENAW